MPAEFAGRVRVLHTPRGNNRRRVRTYRRPAGGESAGRPGIKRQPGLEGTARRLWLAGSGLSGFRGARSFLSRDVGVR
jgi:hypothetical protein